MREGCEVDVARLHPCVAFPGARTQPLFLGARQVIVPELNLAGNECHHILGQAEASDSGLMASMTASTATQVEALTGELHGPRLAQPQTVR